MSYDYNDEAYQKILSDDGLTGERQLTVSDVVEGTWDDGRPRREIHFTYGSITLKRTFSPPDAAHIKKLEESGNKSAVAGARFEGNMATQLAKHYGKTPFEGKNTKALEVGDIVWANIRRGKPKGDRERGFLEIEKFIAPKTKGGDEEIPF